MTDTTQKTLGQVAYEAECDCLARKSLVDSITWADLEPDEREAREAGATCAAATLLARLAELEGLITDLVVVAGWMIRCFPEIDELPEMRRRSFYAIDAATTALGGDESVCERLRERNAQRRKADWEKS